MPRVLIVDDNSDLRDLLASDLSARYEVSQAGSLEEAQRRLRGDAVDLVLLDVTLPDGDGYRFCAALKNSRPTRNLPVIFLTGRAELNDKVMGFTLGADDYVTKPFELAELRLRIDARLRAAAAAAPAGPALAPPLPELLELGNLKVDLHTHRARIGDEQVDLTPVELKLLLWLMRHLDAVYSRAQLIQHIWGHDIHVTARTVDTHVSNLRKKLVNCSHAIVSVHGVGYRLSARPQPRTAPSDKA
jgi:DNA-binding response OmpR family regulator